MLAERGLAGARQVFVPISLMGIAFDEGFRADLLVEVGGKPGSSPLQTSAHLLAPPQPPCGSSYLPPVAPRTPITLNGDKCCFPVDLDVSCGMFLDEGAK